MRKALTFAILLVTATLFRPALRAQGVTSDIRGTVTDTSGAAVVGATVTLDDVTKGLSRTSKSDSSGNYEFLQLPPADTFTVTVEFAGFKKEVRSGIVLQTGQQSRVDLALTPGDVAESVTVTVQENASLVQSEESQVGAVVDERMSGMIYVRIELDGPALPIGIFAVEKQQMHGPRV